QAGFQKLAGLLSAISRRSGVTGRHTWASFARRGWCLVVGGWSLRQGKLEYMGAARQSEPLRAGHRAPDFRLARLENGAVQGIADLGKLLPGGPVLLAFFKSSCPVCQMTLPFLERIHRGRAPASLEIYGVSQDDAETTQEF